MEDDGIVGAFAGSKSREVMLTLEEWHARLEAEAEAESEEEYEDGEYEDDDEVSDGVVDEQSGAKLALAVPEVDGGVSSQEAEVVVSESLGSVSDGVTPDASKASSEDSERPEGT
jgi:hypothetical protein